MKYSKMPELKDIVQKLMASKTFKSQLEHVVPERILYAAFSSKSAKAAARIGRIPSRFAVFMDDFDYFLEVHIESWLQASEGKKYYIILHELTHIPVEGFNKESKYYKKVVDHDLEDFRDLVKEYGIDLENVDKLTDLVK